MKQKKAHKKTHQCWRDMRQRCNNPNSHRYYTHGARGIKVCKEWEESYKAFLDDMGEKPDGFTIERLDNNKGYYKENCTWASPKEQAQNRRTTRHITYNNQTKTLLEWAKEIGLSHNAMSKRLKNWSIEKAINTPRQEKFVRNVNDNH